MAEDYAVVNGQLAAAGRGRVQAADRRGAILVLTYAHTGADLLQSMLAADQSLACTSGTGVVPVCHAALMAWQALERRAVGPSDLAVRSVRALAATMITAIQADTGASRWCETAIAPPGMASSFLQVFPARAAICLHRSLRGVLAEGVRVYPWGLGSSRFWAFADPDPGNNIATITYYWVTSADQLLAFEASHADHSLLSGTKS